MSLEHITLVWEKSPQSGSRLLMLLALATYADDQGIARTAISTLANKCRCSFSQAQRILNALIKMEEIASISAPGKPSEYHLIGYTLSIAMLEESSHSYAKTPLAPTRGVSSHSYAKGTPILTGVPLASTRGVSSHPREGTLSMDAKTPLASTRGVLSDSLKKKKKLINLNNNIQESSSSANEIVDKSQTKVLVIKASEQVQRIVANLGLFGKYSANILESEMISPARIAGCLAYTFDRENKIRNHLAVAAANASNGFVIPEKYNGWSAWKRYIPEQYLEILRPDLPEPVVERVEETEEPELYGEIIMPSARALDQDELDNYVRIQEALITDDTPKPTVEIILNTWLYDLDPNGDLVVGTDSEKDQEWLTARIKTSMERAATGVFNRSVQVSFRKIDL